MYNIHKSALRLTIELLKKEEGMIRTYSNTKFFKHWFSS